MHYVLGLVRQSNCGPITPYQQQQIYEQKEVGRKPNMITGKHERNVSLSHNKREKMI